MSCGEFALQFFSFANVSCYTVQFILLFGKTVPSMNVCYLYPHVSVQTIIFLTQLQEYAETAGAMLLMHGQWLLHFLTFKNKQIMLYSFVKMISSGMEATLFHLNTVLQTVKKCFKGCWQKMSTLQESCFHSGTILVEFIERHPCARPEHVDFAVVCIVCNEVNKIWFLLSLECYSSEIYWTASLCASRTCCLWYCLFHT